MLARERRLRSGDEIREVIKSGKRVSNSFATIHFLHSPEPKFAVVASKALGNAVARNLIRRRTKAAIYGLFPNVPAISGVVRVRVTGKAPSFAEITSSLTELFGRIK